MREKNQDSQKQKSIISPVKVIKMESPFAVEKRKTSHAKTIVKKIAKFFFSLILLMVSASLYGQAQYFVNVNTIAIPPVNPVISQYVSSGNIRVTFATTSANYPFAYAQGSIECLSPNPFTITMNSQFRFNQGLRVSMTVGVPAQLTVAQMMAAFGNFNEQLLQVQGINISAIKDANNNIKLPEGVYRICFAARDIGANMEPTTYFSDPNSGCATFTIAPTQPVNGVIINTRTTPPINAYIAKAILSGGVNSTLQFNNPTGGQVQVKLFGKIESLSPNPFTISLNPDYNQQQAVTLTPGIPVQLTANQIADAFGNFNENNLVVSGINLSSLKDANNNIKLPDGIYKICFYARYFNGGVLGGNASNSDMGCATFNICANAAAPQFTQPASNFTISSKINIVTPRTPMIFTWTPPNSTCGANISAITYNFEIREMLTSQTVTDAINNPPVFIKTFLPSSTFILDTNLYKNVLQSGHQYVIRVRANPAANSPVQIENDGYSRVEAFQYGETKALPESQPAPKPESPKMPDKSTIATSVIKGKAIWSFKKNEEELPQQIDNGLSQKMLPNNLSGAQTVSAVKYAIDPNFSEEKSNYNSAKPLQVNSPGVINKIATSAVINDITQGTIEKNIYAAVSGDGTLIEKKDLGIPSLKGKITHPLSGAVVLLKGVKAKGTTFKNITRISSDIPVKEPTVSLATQLGIVPANKMEFSAVKNTSGTISNALLFPDEKDQDEDLIGSGTTDANGNFIINFIDPKFRNITQYTKLHLTIDHSDFEKVDKYLDVVQPDESGNVDLGDVQLVAKTYRFTPYINSFSKFAQNLEIALYCPVQVYDQNPHYAFMGTGKGTKEKKMIAGKEYIKIASLQNGETINKLFYQYSSASNFILKITADKKADYTTYVGLTPIMYSKNSKATGRIETSEIDESQKVISLKKRYELKGSFPFIQGTVQLNRGDGIIPVVGTVITVTFDKTKIKEQREDLINNNTSQAPAATVSNNPDKLSSEKIITATPLNSKANQLTKTVKTKQSKSKAVPAPENKIAVSAPLNLQKINTNTNFIIGEITRYTAVTDSAGNYRIDDLPVLSEGDFTVTCQTNVLSDKPSLTIHAMQRNDSAIVPFQLNPAVVTVTGIVVDDGGKTLSNSSVRWKSGGNPMIAENGLFTLKNIPGKDSLIISRFGYQTRTIAVEVKKEDSKQPTTRKANKKGTEVITPISFDTKLDNFVAGLKNQPSVKTIASQNNTISPSLFGYAVNTSPVKMAVKESQQYTAIYKYLFNDLDINSGFQDLGKVGYLEKSVAKIMFHVTDAITGNPISGSVIRIGDSLDITTSASGEKLYIGGGEGVMYTVKGPDGSSYVIVSGEINDAPSDGSVTQIEIKLEKGIKISGKVTSKGKNIADADIYIDGKQYITTKSTADGSYALFIPKGENKIQSTKSGYVGDFIQKNFASDETKNFELGDGGGKNISKLLGFDIELESHQSNGAGEIWTGSFVKLKSNEAFSALNNTKIKFTNIKVSFDASGNPSPEGGIVKTDVTELQMKLFGYIPVQIKGSPQIVVSKGVDGKGRIGGKIQLSLQQIGGGGGLLFDNYVKPLLVPVNSSIDEDVAIFTSDGSIPYALNFAFSFARDELKKAADKIVNDFQQKTDKATGSAKAALQDRLTILKQAAADASSQALAKGVIPSTMQQNISAKIFGFEGIVNLAQCKIDKSGMDMAGAIISPDLPIVSSMVFDIEKLRIATDFSVQNVSVKSAVNLKFNIVNWSAEVNAVGFNMNGFNVGGKIDVTAPSSPTSTLQFANLKLALDRMFGGDFTLPSSGINVFNIINLQSGPSPITFGEVGNSGVFKVGGSAKFSFGKLLTETIDVPYFQVQTDGKFAIQVPINKSMDVGFAKFTLNSMTFNTTGSAPQIDVNGQFTADVKLIKFSAGNIHFKSTGGGISVSVDKIGIGLDIPGTNVDAYVDIRDNGFAGGGSLSIAGTPVKASIDFHYFKTNGGVDLGANFVADVKIPLGFVIITKVGGGFTYRSNPEFFSVTITGGASITGFETAVSLDPISITVESGPKIIGEAHLKVATLDVAKATLVIDIPNSYFALGIVMDIEPVPDLVRAHIQGDLIISGKKGDSYFFLGCGMDVKLLGLINAKGVFAIGAGVNNAKTRETISYYMNDAPDQYLSNGSFTGIYVRAKAEVGVKESDAWGFDIAIASLKLWLYTSSDNFIIANFNNGNFMISANMYFEGGIQACLVGLCATASAKACVGISGGYNNSIGWNFAASASGEAILGLGSSCDCNDVCIGAFYAGAKICVGAGAKIRYESRTGGLKELSMYLGSRANCN